MKPMILTAILFALGRLGHAQLDSLELVLDTSFIPEAVESSEGLGEEAFEFINFAIPQYPGGTREMLRFIVPARWSKPCTLVQDFQLLHISAGFV
jgi:ABC-type uncharacterized transport system permease subunit